MSPVCCQVCARPLEVGGICGRCLAHPPAFAATRACFIYAHPLNLLIHQWKYGGRLLLTTWFARQLLGGLQTEAYDLILPMPLHQRRLRERGFNQSMELVKAMARQGGLPPIFPVVSRVRDTSKQEGLDRHQRRANLRGAFVCTERLAGERVLLVDDVMTTGASLEALARCLKQAGAGRVENLVLARTP